MALPNPNYDANVVKQILAVTNNGNKQMLTQMFNDPAKRYLQPAIILAGMQSDADQRQIALQQGAQPTVAAKTLGVAPPPPAPPAGLGSLPPGAPAPQGAPPMQMASAPPPMGMPQMAGGGLTTLPVPDAMFDEQTFAGGGIVAFARGDKVDAKAERIKALMAIVRKGGPEGAAARVQLNSMYGQGSSDMGLPDLAPLVNATYDGPRGMALLDALDKYTGMPQPGDRAPQPVSSLRAGKPGFFGNPGAFTPPDMSSITDAAQRQNDADTATSYGLPFSAPDMSGFGRLAANIGNADAAGDVLHAAGAGMAAKGLYDKLPSFRPLADPKKVNWDPMSNPGYGVKTEKPWYADPVGSGFSLPTKALPKALMRMGDKHPEYGPKSLPMPEDDLYGTLPQFDVAGGSKPTPAARALADITSRRTPTDASTTTPPKGIAALAGEAAGRRGAAGAVGGKRSVAGTKTTSPAGAVETPELTNAQNQEAYKLAGKLPAPPGTSAEEKAARKNEDLWTSLAQIGFGMAAGKSQNALSNIGEAAAAAMPGMQASLKERRADDKEDLKQQYAFKLAEAGVSSKAFEYAMNRDDSAKDLKLKIRKLDEDIRHNQEVEKLQGQQIAASGVTGTERLVQLMAAGMPGGATPENLAKAAEIGVKGYTGAGTGAEIYNKAGDNVDAAISKNTVLSQRLRKLEQQDKKNAKAGIRSTLYDDEYEKLKMAEYKKLTSASLSPLGGQTPEPRPTSRIGRFDVSEG